ncbi:MAG: translation initiation factor IF-1 [Polyangiaceae bacterium]
MSSFKEDDRERDEIQSAYEAGLVEEVLPRGMFRVRLDSGQTVRVGLTPTSRHSMVRLISGDRVQIKVSSHDPSRGHIIKKL